MYDRFIVIKDFYKIGSAVLCYDKDSRAKCVADYNVLRAIAKSPIQIVAMGGEGAMDMYSEYKPYTIMDHSTQMEEIRRMVIEQDVPGEPNPFVKLKKD